MGLAIWDKPAAACLSSRIPYGTSVTRERLAQIGGFEAALKGLGFRQVRVRYHDELLGMIAVEVPATDPLTPEQERLLAELAAQAGLVLRNVGLTAELRGRLLELQRSRERLVAAQDEQRRRIERNLHDGAQQQLIALTVKARLAEQVAERDPTKSAALLRDIHQDAQSALEDLRDLEKTIKQRSLQKAERKRKP